MSTDTSDHVAEILGERGARLAVAESLTGGLLANRFAASSGASEWFCGSVVAYQKPVKYAVLDVPEGPVVTEEAALTMAEGVQRLMRSDHAVAVTGAGGPEPQDGQPPGTVWIAVLADGRRLARGYRFAGDPKDVIDQSVDAAVELLAECLRG
jgi:nicotinamide-nucleotide amidase